ncbi:MAG: hypothetical protein FWH14_07030 [Oscillospiraceae bacterium]|nr:hypothetical protein [Oscillospiraceae bacterium]
MNESVIEETNTDEKTENNIVKSSVKAGISFGSCLAIVISYTAWESIPWAILHGLLSWFYVVYYLIAH